MTVVAVLMLHLASLPYAQLAQPDPLLAVVVLLLSLLDVLVARRNLFEFEFEESEELEDLWLSLSLLGVLPMDLPWATYEARHTHAANQKMA